MKLKRTLMPPHSVELFSILRMLFHRPNRHKRGEAENHERGLQFLKDAECSYIATVEGDQPRVRPFGTIHIFEGKLYIQPAPEKERLPPARLQRKDRTLRHEGDEWIRLSGTLVRRQSEGGEGLDARRLSRAQEDVQRRRRQYAGALFQGCYGDDLLFSHEPVVIKF